MGDWVPLAQNRWLWRDTCNVYVLQEGESALLIDLGDGSVLDALPRIGVRQVEWVLFTHHHREQCQGAARLRGTGARVAVPGAERAFFEDPLCFRRMRPRLDDPYSCYGSSYLRPPRTPVAVDHAFAPADSFAWRGLELWVVPTPGNSPGHTAYLLRHGEEWVAFSGDLMLDGARMHTWYDTEWDYGYAAGLKALYESVVTVERFSPACLYPAHGPVVTDPARQFPLYREKLRHLTGRYLRGWDMQFPADDADTISRPSAVPHLWQLTPHLYRYGNTGFGPNFTLILADSGRALLVDFGCVPDDAWWDRTFALMRERLGLKSIDAVIITHMHGDHIVQCPYLRQRFGTQIWTLDRITELFEHPERFDYTCPISAYGGPERIPIDRSFRAGETLEWEGISFTFDWLPGQTEFGLCLHAEIDGRRVAWTGDNVYASSSDSGHDAVMARNSGILEEGYLYCAEYLCRLQPDLILAGHSSVIPNPAAQLERFRRWSYEIRDAFQALSSDPDYRYWFDPFWVRAYPYRSWVVPGGRCELTVSVRNFYDRPQSHRLMVRAPEGWGADPAVLEGTTPAEGRTEHRLSLAVPPTAAPGVAMVTFDVQRDGVREGELFDALVQVEA